MLAAFIQIMIAQRNVLAGISATGCTDSWNLGFSVSHHKIEVGLVYRLLFRNPIFWPAQPAYDNTGALIGWNSLKWNTGRQESRDFLNGYIFLRYYPEIKTVYRNTVFLEGGIYAGKMSDHSHPPDIFGVYPRRFDFIEPSLSVGVRIPIWNSFSASFSAGVSNPVYHFINNQNQRSSYWVADGITKCMTMTFNWQHNTKRVSNVPNSGKF